MGVPVQPSDPRGMWCSNHICEGREVLRKQAIHRARLQQIKPMVDQSDPRRPKTANSKGARQLEERNAQIFHENSLLLDKLSKILTRPSMITGVRQPLRKGRGVELSMSQGGLMGCHLGRVVVVHEQAYGHDRSHSLFDSWLLQARSQQRLCTPVRRACMLMRGAWSGREYTARTTSYCAGYSTASRALTCSAMRRAGARTTIPSA